MNKTNHPMSGNSHPSATANKAIHWLVRENSLCELIMRIIHFPMEHFIYSTKYKFISIFALVSRTSEHMYMYLFCFHSNWIFGIRYEYVFVNPARVSDSCLRWPLVILLSIAEGYKQLFFIHYKTHNLKLYSLWSWCEFQSDFHSQNIIKYKWP